MNQNSYTACSEWALKYRKPGTEPRHIDGRYHLYSDKTVCDPLKKGTLLLVRK